MEEVKYYKEKQKIKTYQIKEPDINPFISEYLGSLMFYPYPLKNNIEDKPEEKEYELFTIENKYFKIKVLPELGGKLYSAFDKRSEEYIFYKNPVIKPQLVGCTGAWTSGGIEFNFPNRGHRPSVTDYTDTIFKKYEDGSASIIISEVGMIAWMRFSVELKLYPKKAYVEQIVRMYNPNNYKDSYYFWSTSAELEKEGLEFRFPFLWHIEEEEREKYLWPLPGDSPFAAEGVDLRFSDTMKPFTLPFGSEVLKDYMGLYYPKEDNGVVHVADFREVPGKKVWSWGQASAGINWCKRLTDNDDRYVELQAGAVETQNEFNYIEPHNKVEYKEYWLHSNNNGRLCAASKEVISSYKIEDSKIKFRFIATDKFDGIKFKLLIGDNEEYSKIIDLDPINNVELDVPFSKKDLNQDITFILQNEKDILLSETILDSNDAIDMIEEEPYISEDEKRISDMSQGNQLEKKRHYNKAIKYYNKVIEENPDYIEAYLKKATCLIKKRKYKKSLKTLENIRRENPENVSLNYLYGLTLWYNDKHHKSVKYLYKVPNSSNLFPAANYLIALYLIYKNEYKKALNKIKYSIKHFPHHYKSNQLMIYVLYKMGKTNQAGDVLNRYLENDPLDYIAVYLKSINQEDTQDKDIILRAKQNVYNILSFFDELKDWGKCVQLIEDYEKSCKNCDKLLTSYLIYYKNKLRLANNSLLAKKLNNISLDYIFPNHDIDYKILKSIKEQSKKAKYLFGLIQYRAENFDSVKKNWEELVDSNFNYSVIYRNLSYYYQKYEDNYEKSVEYAEIGFDKKPFNDDFFKLLYDGYKKLGQKEKIKNLLTAIEDFENKSEPCMRVWIDMLNYYNQHEKAVEVLEKTNFKIYEHDPENLIPYPKIYKESYLGLSQKNMSNNDYKLALNNVQKCLAMEKKHEEKFAEIYFYAAVINEKLGDFSEAINYYNKIIEEDIDEEDKENYKFYVKAANRIVKLNWIGIQ